MGEILDILDFIFKTDHVLQLPFSFYIKAKFSFFKASLSIWGVF